MHMVLAPISALAAEPVVTTLPNGLTVLVQEDTRFPLASLRLYVRAGSAYETPEQAGISHLLEHMVFKGTANRAPGQVASDVEGAGGALNAATSFDYTVFYTDMPADQWRLGMDVLHDMVFNASIDPEELAREKQVVLAELKRNEDTPESLLFKRVQPLTWPDTAYELPIIGTEETVNAITSQDIKDYIARYYQPQSMLLVVCGDVDAKDVIQQATALFGNLANNRDISPPEPISVESIRNAQQGEARLLAINGEWNKTYLSITFPLPGLRSAQSATLEVLAHLLGGDDTSRLYRTFKYDKQLVDDISASALTLDRAGMFYIYATLDTDKVETFWKALIEELAHCKAQDFTDEELSRAKLNLEDALYRTKETLPGLASKLGFFQFFENGGISEQNYLYQMNNATREQLQEAIDTYFRPDALSCVVLAPGADQPLQRALEQNLAQLWPSPEAKTAAQHKSDAGGIRTIELGDGKKLILMPDNTLPYTSVSITMLGGDSLLSPEAQGLAELAANTLTTGTAKRSANELDDFLSNHAAELNASATRDTMVLNAKYPSRFSKELLPLIREVMTTPAFAPEEVAREKTNQVAAIKSREDKPLGLAFRNIFPFLYVDHPYDYFHLGTIDGVQAFTAEQIKEFWDKQKGAPWTMAVCGDFDPEAIRGLAEHLVGDLKPSLPDKELPAFQSPDWRGERELTLQLANRNQTHLLQIYKIPPLDHEDTPGLKLLREILAGQSGLLFNRLRDEQGLGYSVTAMNWQSPATGFMAFYIGTYPEKAQQALEGFNAVVQELQETPLSDEAIQRGKNLLQGDYYREHQSLSSRSREAATLSTLGQPLDANVKDIEKAQKLTARDLQNLVRKYLQPENAYLLTVAP